MRHLSDLNELKRQVGFVILYRVNSWKLEQGNKEGRAR